MRNLLPHCATSRPRPRVALLLLFLAALPGVAFAQKSAALPPTVASTPPSAALPALTQKQMLDGDSRLDRFVSLDVISVPLNEVLQKESLDKSTDTMEDGKRFLLTAAPDCADLKLQIRLNHRSLRVLMTALAQMVPGTWTRTPHGYQIAMTKQAANARAEWWRLFLGERDKSLAAQRRAVLATMQTKAHRRQANDPEPEPSDHAVDEELADQHDFFYSLPSVLKGQIAASMDDSGFYELGGIGYGNSGEKIGTIGWLSQMSPETQEKFKAALQDNITNHLAPAPPALQKYAIQAQRDMSALDPGKIYFLFQNGGIVVYATPFNCPSSVATLLELQVPLTAKLPVLSLNQAPLIKAVGKMGASAPDEWKRLADYQHSRVWPNLLPNLPPEDRGTWRPAISRAAQMDWLGEQGHVEYVSDYYSHGGYAMPEAQRKLPVKRPLATELDEMAAKRDVSWMKDADGVYLVRNNRWYRDDSLEVPEPLLRRWFARLLQTRREQIARQQKAAQAPQTALQTATQTPEERTAAMKQNWDWVAEMFSTLTPWQIRNGLLLFQPEEKELAPQNDSTAAKLYEKLKHYIPQPGAVVPPGYDALSDATRRPPFYSAVTVLKGFPHTAQLYGSLDEVGRSTLLAGCLPASALSLSQLAQAAALQPYLPAALQHSPPDSVLLGLLSRSPASYRVIFGEVPPMGLEISTPQSSVPPGPPGP